MKRPIPLSFDPKTLGQCESANRDGRRCIRNAGCEEMRNGKLVKLCRHHRQRGAFRAMAQTN